MPKLFQADDFPTRKSITKSAIEESGNAFFSEFTFLECVSEDAYKESVMTLQKDTSDKVILLDLGFQEKNEAIWKSVKKNLELLCSLALPSDAKLGFTPRDTSAGQPDQLQLVKKSGEQLGTILDSRLGGLSLLGVIGGKSENAKILVIVVSQLNPDDIQLFLETIQAGFAKDGWTNLRLERDSYSRSPNQANKVQSILQDAEKRWKELFPTLHPESRVEKMIGSWLEQYGSMPPVVQPKFCAHGTAGEQFTIEGSPEFYKEMLQSVLGVDEVTASSVTDPHLKAVFQMESHENAYLTVGDRSLGYGKNEISSALLASVIGSLSGMEVDLAGSDCTRLPCQPGLPFLASFLVLFARMQTQDDGMLDTDSPILLSVAESGPNRISLPLRRRNDFKWGIANSWKTKIEEFPTKIALEPTKNGGVCPALWDVLEARIRGICFEEDSDDAEEKRLIEGKKQLLKVFGGPGRVVAGISFGPHHIHIHW